MAIRSRGVLCYMPCLFNLVKTSFLKQATVFTGAGSLSTGTKFAVCGYHTVGKSTAHLVKHKINPPRRALLYVPGHDERKIKKISNLQVDCVALDCEDGVALSKKDEARSTIHDLYESTANNFSGELCVRVNSPSSELAQADVDMIMDMPVFPSALIVPKIDDHTELEWFCSYFVGAHRKHRSLLKRPCKIIFMTESARGLLNLQKITEAGIAACAQKTSSCHLSGVIFGSDDFCANVGISRTHEAAELMYARQKIVTVTKAYNLQAIDMVYIDFKDEAGLRQQAVDGARIGFTGKQIIHPDQISVVQECFSPSPEKITWARELIKAFEESEEGAFTFRGQMIDMPTYLQAKNIERLATSSQTPLSTL